MLREEVLHHKRKIQEQIWTQKKKEKPKEKLILLKNGDELEIGPYKPEPNKSTENSKSVDTVDKKNDYVNEGIKTSPSLKNVKVEKTSKRKLMDPIYIK